MFDYVIDKIRHGTIVREPFSHLLIRNLFSPAHFAALTGAPEIGLPAQRSDAALLDRLFDLGYKIIGFPGSVTERDEYLAWHRDRRVRLRRHSACEGAGLTLRLMTPTSPLLRSLQSFLSGRPFNGTLASRFGIDLDDTTLDFGVQSQNNSMVAFAPSDRTLHAVRAAYDHLPAQRTQLYGNLWFREQRRLLTVEWERLDLRSPLQPPTRTLRNRVAERLPAGLKATLKGLMRGRDEHVIINRFRQ